MRAMALQEFHRRKNLPVVTGGDQVETRDFPSLFFRAIERRHSEKYREEREHAAHIDLGGES
jgi:hypothetical protein